MWSIVLIIENSIHNSIVAQMDNFEKKPPWYFSDTFLSFFFDSNKKKECHPAEKQMFLLNWETWVTE